MSRFIRTDRAKADLRQIDREQTLQMLHILTRYGPSCEGDVKRLKGSSDFRLRAGDYRVRFEPQADGSLRVLQVKHRREAYR